MNTSPYILQCPACSAVINFADGINLRVCSSCGSVIWKKEDGSLQSKPQHIISDRHEVIQPGTIGVWEGKSFVVCGRFRAWFEEVVFNYWTIRLSDGKIAWLGEGYGLYSILTPTELGEEFSSYDLDKRKIGVAKKIGKKAIFILDKKQKTIKWEIEGELYIPGMSSFRVLDFSSQEGINISLFEFEKLPVLAFDVKHTSFQQMQLQGLRTYSNTGKEFTCKQCNKPISIKTFPYSQSYGCVSCGAYYSLSNGMDLKKEQASKTAKTDYALVIGAKGIFKGVQYEVIGYSRKEEQNIYHSKWMEYTLYNPEQGFAFLSEYEGHWMYLREKGDTPVLKNQEEKYFILDGTQFDLFNAYTYEVVLASGEFPYNIFDNQKTKVREYISPPYIWIQEKDEKEGIRWFNGIHADIKDIEKAFGLAAYPHKVGIGAIQPTHTISPIKLFKATLLAFIVLLSIHLIISFTKQNKILLEQQIMFSDSSDVVSMVTEKYHLDKSLSNLRFYISAPVRNSWIELNATLVNSVTGKEYSVEQGVEYYFGHSGGEGWSEGSTNETAYLTRIPSGTYFIQLEGLRESTVNKADSYFIRITYDVSNSRNLFVAAILLLLWPIGKYAISNFKEKRRWENSPFSN